MRISSASFLAFGSLVFVLAGCGSSSDDTTTTTDTGTPADTATADTGTKPDTATTDSGGTDTATSDTGTGSDTATSETGTDSATDSADAGDTAGMASLTVNNTLSWCKITINGGAATTAATTTISVPIGTVVPLHGDPASATFIWGKWIGTDGDTTAAHDSAQTTKVTMSGNKTVTVCCPFADGTGC